jgi:hypothetical protein
MRLDALILADAASTPGDGKFYVHGGGLSRFVVPELPCPLGVALFIRFEVDDEDVRVRHRFRVLVFGPVALNIQPLEFESAPTNDPPPLLDGEPRFMQIALNLRLGIVRVGPYRVEVYVDDELVRTLPVPLVLASAVENGQAPGSG